MQCRAVNVGGSASFAGGMVRVGRPLGLQGSVAGDVNPRDGGHVCMVAARVICAPEHGTRRREKDECAIARRNLCFFLHALSV